MKSPLRIYKTIHRTGPEFSILENTIEDAPWQFCEQWRISDIYQQNQCIKSMPGYLPVLQWCMDTIEHSPTGRLILKNAGQEGWSVALTDLPYRDFILDTPRKIITLDNYTLASEALQMSAHFSHCLLINFLRALRELEHEKRHADAIKHYGPENILMLARVRAADTYALVAQIGWELRGAGMPEIWRTMIGAQDGDIALSYAALMEQQPSQSFGKKALSAAFHQWYEDQDRVSSCDHETLEYLDAILQCTDTPHPFGAERLQAETLEILSCLPDKSAYLQGQGNLILRDPAYAGLDDEYNQTHFLQIMHDMQVVMVEDVPFRDLSLAKRLFPSVFTPQKSEAV